MGPEWGRFLIKVETCCVKWVPSLQRTDQKSQSLAQRGSAASSSTAGINPRAHNNFSDSLRYSMCHGAGKKGLMTTHLWGKCCRATRKSFCKFNYKMFVVVTKAERGGDFCCPLRYSSWQPAPNLTNDEELEPAEQGESEGTSQQRPRTRVRTRQGRRAPRLSLREDETRVPGNSPGASEQSCEGRNQSQPCNCLSWAEYGESHFFGPLYVSLFMHWKKSISIMSGLRGAAKGSFNPQASSDVPCACTQPSESLLG